MEIEYAIGQEIASRYHTAERPPLMRGPLLAVACSGMFGIPLSLVEELHSASSSGNIGR